MAPALIDRLDGDEDLGAHHLFCGFGGCSLGAELAGLPVRLGLNHHGPAVRVHELNFPNADHDCTDISAVDPRRYPSARILIAGPECFPAGTLILTMAGWTPVEQVQVGDLVLTHRDRWRPVTRTQSRQGSTVLVHGQGHTPGIEVTPNHRFWLRRSRLTSRRHRRLWDDPEFQPVGDALNHDAFWATPAADHASTHPDVSVPDLPALFRPAGNDAWWLIGRWLADGSLTTGAGRHDVAITCAYEEEPEIASRLDATGRRWRYDVLRTAGRFRIADRQARDWLSEHFGYGSANKQLPGWVLGLPRDERERLLAGYLSGEGSVANRRTHAGTVSKALALSVRLLAESLGYRASLHRYKQHANTIEGRQLNVLPIWTVAWETKGSERETFRDPLNAQSWSPIRAVKPGREDVKVFNLEVAEDHSYVAEGIVVANCTNHSSSKGVSRKLARRSLLEHPDPGAERSRATMWDVVRFTEVHRYLAVIVENVEDVVKWELFNAWINAMQTLGYEAQVVYMNSMVAWPTPQNRDRAYIVFWRKKARQPNLRFDATCYCPRCGHIVQGIQTWKDPRKPWGKLGDRKRNQYVYVCPECAKNPRLAKRAVDAMAHPIAYGAGSAIDWTIPTPRIGDRKHLGLRPLVPSTLRRIENGLRNTYEELLIQVYGHTFERKDYARAWPVSAPSNVVTATLDRALVVPVSRSNDPDGRRPRPVSEPVFTQTARQDMGLMTLSFIVNDYGTSQQPWPVTRPAGAVTAEGNHHFLAIPEPHLVANYGNGTDPGKNGWVRPVGLPAGTVTTVDHHALLVPWSGGTWNQNGRPVHDPANTITTTEHLALFEPQLLAYYRTAHPHGVSEPASTVETRDHHALLDPASLRIEDCGYRMIKPHEIRGFMAFPEDYLIEPGMSDKEQVRGYGNAVTPPVMYLLVTRVLEALGA